jgi:two-component system CheB/CheR fusion protein
MAIVEGLLHITPRPRDAGRPPARRFAVPLAGRRPADPGHRRGPLRSGSDGTLGLCEIKAVGGITFAQDEQSAKHIGMPRSAVASGCVDFVLPPEELARRLAEIGGHPYLAPTPPSAEEFAEAEDQYRKILAAVRSATGVDFSLYRDTTIRRRIMRRMALHGYQLLVDYAGSLDTDRGEVDALYGDLLINVTSFFRDPPMFEALKSVVFPEVIKNRPASAPFRIWVPGCSTGQEAYSLAMALWEFFDDRTIRPPVQIFATDLSDQATLEKARAGLYPESIEAEVSPERMQRFFKRDDHLFRIDKTIRDCCVFARQNVAADPPFSHVDLISCRNVLIYMATTLQKRILPTLHYALNMPGFLVLGNAETVGEFTDLFEIVDRANKIYAKRVAANRPAVSFNLEEYRMGLDAVHRPARSRIPTTPEYQKEADRIVMGRYAPPGVLVNLSFDALQFRGRTIRYLDIPQGEPTANVLKMAREGLFLELRSALNEARSRNERVLRQDVRIRDEHGISEVDLEVLPVKPAGSTEACLLVLFHEKGSIPHPRRPAALPQTARAPKAPAPPRHWFPRLFDRTGSRGEPSAAPPSRSTDSPAEAENARLSQELASTREYMQSLVKQQDAANEELKSANEEILSSNEELQSTNEELQTAKEELQSANEELTTVNEQLQHRNLELNQSTNDMTNLLTSTTIPVVMVGSDLRIRRVTAAARKVMNLLPADVGRLIGDFKANVDVGDLESLIGDVIEHVHVQEREVQDGEGRWHLLRIHPYRTADNKIDGAVIVLVDIDQVKRAQQEARASRAQLAEEVASLSRLYELIATLTVSEDLPAALEQVLYASITLLRADLGDVQLFDPDTDMLKIVVQRGFNEDFIEHFRTVGPDNGSSWARALASRARVVIEDTELDVDFAAGRQLSASAGFRAVQSTPLISRDRKVLAVLSTYFRQPHRPLERELGMLDGYVRLAVNFVERLRAEEALKELDRRKDEFLATLAHELRNPLGPIRNAVQILGLAGGDSEHSLEARNILDRQTEQLTRIVDDLLDMSRIIQGKLELRKQRVALADVVNTALQSTRSFIESRGNRLAVNLPSEPLYLDADPVRLAQVLVNLLNNAAKFTRAGGQIDVTAEHDAAEEQIVISVRDDGDGIPPELLPRMFNMFTQGDNSLERARGGLGVGLTLVRSLVELHDGRVEVKSDGPGKGSEFLVRLPLASPDVPPEPKTPERVAERVPAKPRRILVVDDNEDQTQSLVGLLTLLGHKVESTYDGQSAVEAAAKFVPDLALVDIGLPGMNGYQVARQIRELPGLEHVILVAQTGWGQEEDRRRSREAGFDLHFTKPVDIGPLQELLAALDDRKS